MCKSTDTPTKEMTEVEEEKKYKSVQILFTEVNSL